jgi:SSS family solute:Na+ symporter
VATTAWYLLGNPFGIDNMYVAAVSPLLVLAAERLLNPGSGVASSPSVIVPPGATAS